jgi:small subunit ribosomal protein S18
MSYNKKQAPTSSSSSAAPGAQGNSGSAESPFSKRRKPCPFEAAKVSGIDYKDLDTLKQFTTDRGKILPRRITGVSYYYQKVLKKAIKQARHMALLAFVAEE